LIKEFLMKHQHPPVPVIVILALAILVGGYFGIRALLNKGSAALTASGTIETVEVNISPEIGGKVAVVSVEEGSAVKAGDVLFRLDDTLLQGQRTVVSASLNLTRAAIFTADAAQSTAQANYYLAVNAARLESASTRTSDWRAVNPAGYTLSGGYFSRADEITAAEAEVESARSACDAAQNSLSTLLTDPANAVFVTAERHLANARAASNVAQDVLSRTNVANNIALRAAAQYAYDIAKADLEDAQAAYDSLKDTNAAIKIATSRAELSVAQERFESAQDRLLVLQTGENSPKVEAAQTVLHQALAAVDQAHLAVTQAEASLALLDIQIAKMTVTAPADGTILTSSIQPGEIVAPSAAAMTLGRLDNLTITVYVPENLYGGLYLEQSATMTVDSFPGETFNATVIHIADQAEFTPRNIQTIEGRTSTVFAIKLQVQDPGGKLKPGMPADVVFGK
jgi:multidrug resistance efflux pump